MNPTKQYLNINEQNRAEFPQAKTWFSDDDNNIRQFSDLKSGSFINENQSLKNEDDKHYSLINFESGLKINESFFVVDWQMFDSF